MQYTRSSGCQHTYTIEANGKGTYVISLAGKVLKVGMSTDVMNGVAPAGPQARETAFTSAKAAIEALRGMNEE